MHDSKYLESSNANALKSGGYLQSPIVPKSTVASTVSNLNSTRLNQALNQEEKRNGNTHTCVETY